MVYVLLATLLLLLVVLSLAQVVLDVLTHVAILNVHLLVLYLVLQALLALPLVYVSQPMPLYVVLPSVLIASLVSTILNVSPLAAARFLVLVL